MTTDPEVLRRREDRRAQLYRMTRAQLIRLYRPHYIASAHPLAQWSKDDLVSSVLSCEFRERAES